MTAPAAVDVTVILTCYNHQEYVEQCLESVLHQTTPAARVIVVDDLSTDESGDVIERWIQGNRASSFTFLRHSVNIGLCRSLNEALDLVETTYICHISADDWMAPDRLERQVLGFEALGQDLAFVVSDLAEVDIAGAPLASHDVGDRLSGLTGYDNRHELVRRLLRANIIPAPAVVIRTAALREIGGWDASLAFEDYDAWLRLGGAHGMGYVPGVVTAYRVLPTSFTRDSRRRRSFLTSEAACLLKHVGRHADWDAAIRPHLMEVATQLETMDPAAGRSLRLRAEGLAQAA